MEKHSSQCHPQTVLALENGYLIIYQRINDNHYDTDATNQYVIIAAWVRKMMTTLSAAHLQHV